MKLEVLSHHPKSNDREIPILFIHGQMHGAWCWDDFFLPYFAEKGYHAYALSLRGHCGSEGQEGLKRYSLDDYVEDVADVATKLKKPPVVVGHSMGGAIVQRYLISHFAPAAVLMNSCPPFGMWHVALRMFRRHPLIAFKSLVTQNPEALFGNVDLWRETMLPLDMPEADALKHYARKTGESARVNNDMFLLRLYMRPKKVRTPLLVLGAEKDMTVIPAHIEKTAKMYGAKAMVFPALAHCMMLGDGWRQVADYMINWLGQRGL